MTAPVPSAGDEGLPGVLGRLNDDGLAFLAERHLGVIASIGRDSRIHAVPVGFTVQDGLVRVITSATSQKVRNVERDPRVTIAQVEGRRWVTLLGDAEVSAAPDDVAEAEALYEARYRRPRPNPSRVVIVLRPVRVLAEAALRNR